MNPPPRASASNLQLVAQTMFCMCAAAWMGVLLHCPGLRNSRLPELLFPMLALAATLISLAQTLPVQNVLAVAVLVAGMTSVAEIIDSKSGIPFGQRTVVENFGPQFFGVLPWATPLIWVVAILNSRGVARLILRPWRKLRKYGLWVIGLTSMLTVVFDVALEPFAGGTGRYWIWAPSNAPAWHGAPVGNFLGRFVMTLLTLAFATPWLINKNPSRSAPPDYNPLLIWFVAILILTVGSAQDRLWSAVVVDVATVAVTACFALRGARW